MLGSLPKGGEPHAVSSQIHFSLSVVIATVGVWGCASDRSFPVHAGLSSQIGSVSPVETGLRLAVWLEDQCESRESDDETVTILEALHDALIVPSQMLVAIGTVTVIGMAWSLYDRITIANGETLPNRPEIVMNYVKPGMATPRMSEGRRAHDTPITWSACLRDFNER
jgi:hypothetical protein